MRMTCQIVRPGSLIWSNFRSALIFLLALSTWAKVRKNNMIDQIPGLRDCYDPTRVVVVFLSEKKLLSRTTWLMLTTRRIMASPMDQNATRVLRSSARLRPWASRRRKCVWESMTNFRASWMDTQADSIWKWQQNKSENRCEGFIWGLEINN